MTFLPYLPPSFLPPSLPPPLLSSFPLSLPPSLPPFISASLPISIFPSFCLSLSFLSLPPSLPPSLSPSFPPFPPPSLPPSLPPSPPSLPFFLPPSLPPSLPFFLPPSLPPSLQTELDELSQEDDSVNRVASMIATLQHQACTFPACEPAVLNELLTAVGHGYIDTELVSKVGPLSSPSLTPPYSAALSLSLPLPPPCKALGQVARYLGYSTPSCFLGDHLPHMVSNWLEKEQKLSDFPFQLFGAKSREEFFQSVNQFLPISSLCLPVFRLWADPGNAPLSLFLS